MKDTILVRINQLNIELNNSSGQKEIDCLEQLISLEWKLLNILKAEIISK